MLGSWTITALPRCPNHHRPQHALNTQLRTAIPTTEYFSQSVMQYFSQSIPQYFSDATALHWWVCASIYERLAQAIPAKYSPYSNDTLTDRRREGRNYWLAYESKIRTVCSIFLLLSSVPTNLPTAKPHLPGSKSSAVKAIREIFEYSQAIREMSVCKASDPNSCWIGCYGAVKICNCRLASQKCRSE